MAKRRKIPQLHRIVLDAAKEIRAKKLTFEREASQALSDALGFEVTVKIKRTKLTDQPTLAMRRAARLPKKRVAQQIKEVFDFNKPL